MTVKLLAQSDERQMNPLKSSQQGFSRGTLRRPFGIARIQPCQVFLLVSQALTLFTTPVVYLYLDRLSEWLSKGSPSAKKAGDRVGKGGAQHGVEARPLATE